MGSDLLKTVCELVTHLGLGLLPPMLPFFHSPCPQILGSSWGEEGVQSALRQETPGPGAVGSEPGRPGDEGGILSLQASCPYPG